MTYEFIKTETGWVVCWGGASLYRDEPKSQPQRVAAADAAAKRETADRGPVAVLSA